MKNYIEENRNIKRVYIDRNIKEQTEFNSREKENQRPTDRERERDNQKEMNLQCKCKKDWFSDRLRLQRLCIHLYVLDPRTRKKESNQSQRKDQDLHSFLFVPVLAESEI